jgi:hypothetical protein
MCGERRDQAVKIDLSVSSSVPSMSSRTALTFHLPVTSHLPVLCSASLRKQSGHRQSLPSAGIGRRNLVRNTSTAPTGRTAEFGAIWRRRGGAKVIFQTICHQRGNILTRN